MIMTKKKSSENPFGYGELRCGCMALYDCNLSKNKAHHNQRATGKAFWASLYPSTKEHKILAQVFQAIRIEVNQELEVLTHILHINNRSLEKQEGVWVWFPYHSLEDWLVKRFMRNGLLKPEKDIYRGPEVPFRAIGKFIVP